jgi:two-component system cell cycle response regulator
MGSTASLFMNDKKKRDVRTAPQVPKFGADEQPSIPRVLYDWPDEESSTGLADATLAMPPPSQQAKGRTRALLTVISGAGAGRAFSVRDHETLLGRGKEAHVRLDDAGASRLHARIVIVDDGNYMLEDLESTNGTFVDGKKVSRLKLNSGDRIHIGPNVSVSFAILDSQAEMMTHQLYESAMRDPLTRAYNRRYFIERVASELAFAQRHSGRLALIMFDIDHFKQINDKYGHMAGDEVLREVSSQVTRMIRAEDVFARFGGEEFVLLVRGIEHQNVGRFAERIRMAIERLEVAVQDAVLRTTTVSAGYVSLSELLDDDRSIESLIRMADERMYRAKAAGRNRTSGV